MNKLIKFLNQPYPVTANAWKNIATVTLLIFVILYFFQPFGIQYIERGKKTVILLGYAMVSALVMAFQYFLLPALFPRFYDEKHWTVGRHIFSSAVLLILIALSNILYGYVFHITWQHFNLSVFLSALAMVFIVGIFPITLTVILQQNMMLKKSLRESGLINELLTANGSLPSVPEHLQPLTLAGAGKDTLEIAAGQLLYMEAYGNYVKIHYLKNTLPACKILRATIRQMEDAVAEYPFMAKCHRAFLVNLNVVKHVDGNSQGYRLSLTGCEDEVPVSRAFTAAIKRKIEHPGT
ncbi:MAG: LytTR family transcriptional regulator [Tannerella sp.]|jgi:hypothetical protein|nr:LytTR family transcriptional regulator [Tannerella sp.]